MVVAKKAEILLGTMWLNLHRLLPHSLTSPVERPFIKEHERKASSAFSFLSHNPHHFAEPIISTKAPFVSVTHQQVTIQGHYSLRLLDIQIFNKQHMY